MKMLKYIVTASCEFSTYQICRYRTQFETIISDNAVEGSCGSFPVSMSCFIHFNTTAFKCKVFGLYIYEKISLYFPYNIGVDLLYNATQKV